MYPPWKSSLLLKRVYAIVREGMFNLFPTVGNCQHTPGLEKQMGVLSQRFCVMVASKASKTHNNEA